MKIKEIKNFEESWPSSGIQYSSAHNNATTACSEVEITCDVEALDDVIYRSGFNWDGKGKLSTHVAKELSTQLSKYISLVVTS